jgi:hypothetical protein
LYTLSDLAIYIINTPFHLKPGWDPAPGKASHAPLLQGHELLLAFPVELRSTQTHKCHIVWPIEPPFVPNTTLVQNWDGAMMWLKVLWIWGSGLEATQRGHEAGHRSHGQAIHELSI